jgi:hypothetical protein
MKNIINNEAYMGRRRSILPPSDSRAARVSVSASLIPTSDINGDAVVRIA